MYQIVCDAEGCDTVERCETPHFILLPKGWKTVEAVVPWTEEELKTQKNTLFDIGAPVMSAEEGHLCRFVLCPKHAMPAMKPEAAERPNETYGRQVLLPRLRPHPAMRKVPTGI